ncbi:HTH-type transcriptional regulator TtgR [mine drainage metagenome]|uniref:HTH-type transcriptional regulator TtgR n=1 Tax=mine drainage metagenome TaxID=410659 RepID=A0A1J5QBN1_9ZZZZ
MRVSREQVQENRRIILEAAGRLFRKRGFEAVTVADVMKSAGLTHGGFYGYFKNKDDLIAQTLTGLLGGVALPSSDLAVLAARYLSPPHRDDFECGCPVAALASDTIRQSGEARAEMTAGLRRQIALLSQIAPGEDAAHQRRAAIGSWAAMIGALILARMTDDEALSEEILGETAAWIAARSDETDAAPERTAPSRRG